MLKIKYTRKNVVTTAHNNLSKQIKKCPFCGKGFTFYKTEFDRNDGYHGIEQYFLHDTDDKIDCILDQSGFSIGAGDANIDKNYIGEYATTWNEQLTATKIKNFTLKYKLEAYDKDHDIYTLISIHTDIDFLKQLGLSLWNSFSLSANINNEPIDWLIISTEDDETPICYLDTIWKNY